MRAFIGIKLTDCIEEISNLISELKKQEKNANYTKLENIHLTLEFLGEISENQVEIIRKIFKELNYQKFTLEIRKLSNLKNMYVCYLKENPYLFNLQKIIHEKLKNEKFKLEDRKFLPHITIAREVNKKIDKELNFTSIVDSIYLFQSTRVNKELKYIPIIEKKF